MKSSIIIAIAALLITSCATSNYGKIKYSRITSQNTNDTKNIQNSEVKQIANDEKTIPAETTHEVVLDTLNSVQVKSKIDSNVLSEKKKGYASLRKKLQQTNEKQLAEISSIQSQRNDTIVDEKDYNKFADSAIIFGGLSFIPVIGWIFSILAMIMGAIGIRLYKKYPDRYRGTNKRAIVGIILGVCTIIAGAIITVLIFASL